MQTEPRERPILFKGDMVCAILADRKWNTRRLRGLDKINERPDRWRHVGMKVGLGSPATEGKLYAGFVFDDGRDRSPVYVESPYGKTGDALYAREQFSGPWELQGVPPRYWPPDAPIYYWADGRIPPYGDWTKPKPSIHMPKRFARLWLRVEDVRVERVQEITEEDAKAEGVVPRGCDHPDCYPGSCASSLYRPAFLLAWNEINGKRFPWEQNPFVWVVKFSELEERPQ